MKILVINGPNLQMLGVRRPEIYGSGTLAELEKKLRKISAENGAEIVFFQSNHEGDIVDRIAAARKDEVSGIIINPAAYTHTSIAIRDALESVGIPAIEVHISNIYGREEFRHKSMTAPVCKGVISGLGTEGYEWALRSILNHIKKVK
jgi:3-dehydroquinate dehydratase II